MKYLQACVVLWCLSVNAYAAEPPAKPADIPDHAMSSPLPEDYQSPGAPPEAGKEIRKYAIDEPGPTASNFGVTPMQDDALFATLMMDRLEYRSFEGEEVFLWDAKGWYGADYNKLWFKSEGEQKVSEGVEAADLQVLYGRSISRYWDLLAGPRYDVRPEPQFFYGVIGLQGLAPQWFEVETNLYVSEEADMSADFEAEYDILLSQRLVLQPRMELLAAVQDVPEIGVGAGLNSFEMGLRLRYELSRKFAPYAGISWERKVGETADFARAEQEETSKFYWLLGLKFWL